MGKLLAYDPVKRTTVSTALRFDTLAKCNFRCHYCGTRPAVGDQLVVDHVTPVAVGGLTAASNLVAACQACNDGKSSKVINAPQVPDSLPLVAYGVGRKMRYPEKREAAFAEGTLARIKAVLTDDENQVSFIRDAVIAEIDRREKR